MIEDKFVPPAPVHEDRRVHTQTRVMHGQVRWCGTETRDFSQAPHAWLTTRLYARRSLGGAIAWRRR